VVSQFRKKSDSICPFYNELFTCHCLRQGLTVCYHLGFRKSATIPQDTRSIAGKKTCFLKQNHFYYISSMKIKLKPIFLTALLVCVFGLLAKSQMKDPLPGGSFGLGVRTTMNVFGDYQPGLGAGSQWKLNLNKWINTQWFLDYITSRKGESVFRQDIHIGWSVQFAISKQGFRSRKVVPYFTAGHCFDWTTVGIKPDVQSPTVFTSAVQTGLGISCFLHPKVELNLQSQYMLHLGKHVHAEDDGHSHGPHTVVVEKTGLDGHLLSTVSLNFYFLQLWNR